MLLLVFSTIYFCNIFIMILFVLYFMSETNLDTVDTLGCDPCGIYCKSRAGGINKRAAGRGL